MITFIRRALALAKIRSLEIQLHGQNEAMQLVTEEDTRFAISLARHRTRAELLAARQAYTALLPAGHRQTWRIA